jgi:probable rRNA maturation factor
MLSDNILIQYEEDYPQIESVISSVVLELVWTELKLDTPVNFVFMSDDDLLNINQSILNHDYYTDVITFNYDDEDIEYNEVLVSVDRVLDNALAYNTTLKLEIHRICFHGLLHLAGYDDQTEEDKTEMTKLENQYLTKHCST